MLGVKQNSTYTYKFTALKNHFQKNYFVLASLSKTNRHHWYFVPTHIPSQQTTMATCFFGWPTKAKGEKRTECQGALRAGFFLQKDSLKVIHNNSSHTIRLRMRPGLAVSPLQ